MPRTSVVSYLAWGASRRAQADLRRLAPGGTLDVPYEDWRGTVRPDRPFGSSGPLSGRRTVTVVTAPDAEFDIDPRQLADSVLRLLRSRPEGLDEREAQRRLVTYGRNELERRRGRSWARQLLRQFTHPLALLLWVHPARQPQRARPDETTRSRPSPHPLHQEATPPERTALRPIRRCSARVRTWIEPTPHATHVPEH